MHDPVALTATASPNRSGDELLSGSKAIAAYIGKSERQTHYLLEKGRLPAFKLGNCWHMRPGAHDQLIARLEDAAMARALRKADAA